MEKRMEEFRKLDDIILTDKINSKNNFYREACRAIIFDQEKIILLKSKKFGEYIVPGGGVNQNESYFEALKREVLEEAGIKIKNIVPFSTITEYRKPLETKYDLFIMKSFVFCCEIESENHPTNMETYEIDFGYETFKVDLDEAIANNLHLINDLKQPPWIHRETAILLDVKANYQKS